MADELFQNLLKTHHPRLAVNQGQEDQRKGVLQRRELVELGEHDLGIGVFLQLQHQADRLLQVALVPRGGNAGDAAVVDQLGDPLFNAVAGSLVGHLVDDDAEAALAVLFDLGPGAERDRAAARVVAAPQPGPAADDVARGEVRPGNDFHQFVDRDVGLVDQADQGVADLHQIVRRD